MANRDAPSGFTPVRHINGSPWNGAVELCYIPSTDGTATFIGDLVKSAGSADADGIPTVAQAAASNTVLGVVVGFQVNPSDLSEQYRKASEGRYVYVCTDPTVVYEAQEDSVGSNLAATDVGANVNFVVGSGSTVSGLSGMEIDSSSVVTTALPLRLLRLAQRADNAIGTNAKWEVLIVEHEYLTSTGV